MKIDKFMELMLQHGIALVIMVNILHIMFWLGVIGTVLYLLAKIAGVL